MRKKLFEHTLLLLILGFLLLPIWLFQSKWILTNLLIDLPILIFLNIFLLIYFMESEVKKFKYRSVFLLVIAAISVFASFLRMVPLPVGMTLSFLLPILSGAVYGSAFGLIVGQLSMLIGGVFLGALGPWTPYQSFLMGVVGYYAGYFFHKHHNSKCSWGMIILYSVAVSFAYGYWMSVSYWSVAVQNVAVPSSWIARVEMYTKFYFTTSMIWDLSRAIGNLFLFTVLFSSTQELLERAKQRLTYYQ